MGPRRLAASALLLALAGLRHEAEPPPVRLTTDGLEKQRPCWSPDGRRLTFARHEPDLKHIFQYILDPSRPDEPRRLLDRDLPVDYNGAFGPDGSRLLVAVISLSGMQGIVDIALVNADGTGLKVLTDDPGGKLAHQDWPSWSPDGLRFAYSSTHEGNQEIYSSSIDGSGVVRLTQHAGHDAHPCWAPDGSRVVFATDRWGGLELASVRPDGTGLARLTESPGFDDYPAVAPDGRLAFVSNRDGNYEIYVAEPDGTNPRNLTRHPARDAFPCWTPDGSSVTFVSDRDGGADLYTLRGGR